MSVMHERETLTTLLDDVAKLQKVAETLAPDDERVQTRIGQQKAAMAVEILARPS